MGLALPFCFDLGMIDPVAARDFFISYRSADRPWAEWIAWELEAAGYTTLIQAWDFRPGTDWAVKMQEGTTEWSRILAVLSPHFFESKFTRAEWTSVFAKPDGRAWAPYTSSCDRMRAAGLASSADLYRSRGSR
jgi:hypothetical protein